jgi:hypothetical protein
VLEAVGNTYADVVIVLAAVVGGDVQVGLSRVEVPRFEPRSPRMPYPDIQPSSEL